MLGKFLESSWSSVHTGKPKRLASKGSEAWRYNNNKEEGRDGGKENERGITLARIFFCGNKAA